MLRYTAAILIALTVLARPAWSDVQEYEDFAQWQSAAGSFTTIGFDEYAPGTFITDQYAEQGVFLSDGDDFILPFSPVTFPQDGYGLDANGAFTLEFSQPMTAVAVHFPGEVSFELYADGELMFTSGPFFPGLGGINGFGGLVSTQPFDRVVIFDPFDYAVIDNLYFGPPIPGPAGLAVLLCGFLTAGTRRRS